MDHPTHFLSLLHSSLFFLFLLYKDVGLVSLVSFSHLHPAGEKQYTIQSGYTTHRGLSTRREILQSDKEEDCR